MRFIFLIVSCVKYAEKIIRKTCHGYERMDQALQNQNIRAEILENRELSWKVRSCDSPMHRDVTGMLIGS